MSATTSVYAVSWILHSKELPLTQKTQNTLISTRVFGFLISWSVQISDFLQCLVSRTEDRPYPPARRHRGSGAHLHIHDDGDSRIHALGLAPP